MSKAKTAITDIDELIGILKQAKKRKIKEFGFNFKNTFPEIEEIGVSKLTGVTIYLRKKKENKMGKCWGCGKRKYLSYERCGECWKKQEKINAINAQDARGDITL